LGKDCRHVSYFFGPKGAPEIRKILFSKRKRAGLEKSTARSSTQGGARSAKVVGEGGELLLADGELLDLSRRGQLKEKKRKKYG